VAFIRRGDLQEHPRDRGRNCSFEERGATCCGQARRCDKPPCGA
jgi:hypothetical protein